MKAKVLLVPLAAFALSACAGGWFGHSHHRPVQGSSEEWHPPSEMLVKYDANRDGTLTRAELEAGLKADFDKDDADHSGCLNKDEVRAINQRRWEEDRSASSPLVDFKGLGCIDFDEFAAAPRSLFDQMDANADGKLTPDELHPQAKARNPNGGGQWQGRHGRGGDQGPDGGEGPGGDGSDPDGD